MARLPKTEVSTPNQKAVSISSCIVIFEIRFCPSFFYSPQFIDAHKSKTVARENIALKATLFCPKSIATNSILGNSADGGTKPPALIAQQYPPPELLLAFPGYLQTLFAHHSLLVTNRGELSLRLPTETVEKVRGVLAMSLRCVRPFPEQSQPSLVCSWHLDLERLTTYFLCFISYTALCLKTSRITLEDEQCL